MWMMIIVVPTLHARSEIIGFCVYNLKFLSDDSLGIKINFVYCCKHLSILLYTVWYLLFTDTYKVMLLMVMWLFSQWNVKRSKVCHCKAEVFEGQRTVCYISPPVHSPLVTGAVPNGRSSRTGAQECGNGEQSSQRTCVHRVGVR